MLIVTEAATALLAQMLDEQNVPDGTAVRFRLEGEGIALEQGAAEPGDTTFEHEGRTVLVLDELAAEVLSGGKLDAESDKLTLLGPQVEE